MADTEVLRIILRRRPTLRGLALLLVVPAAPFWAMGTVGVPPQTPEAALVTRAQVLGFRIESATRHAFERTARTRRPAIVPALFVGSDGARVTPGRLKDYLDRQSSPLALHAEILVRAGMAYNVDPRVVVAISGVESSFGVYRYGYNAWGYGRYRWSSWNEAIAEYTRHISIDYPSMRQGNFGAVASRYAPPHPGRWATRAAMYFSAI